MLKDSVRTIYNIHLQNAKLLGIPYKPLFNTTLNEKFKIYPEFILNDFQTYPNLNTYVIGIGGTKLIDSNELGVTVGKHSPLDAALFKHVPFRVTPIDENIPPEEELNYRLKRIERINDKDYYVYYAKHIKLLDITYDNRIYKLVANKLEFKATVYDTIDEKNFLEPKPKTYDERNTEKGEFISSLCKIRLSITKDELESIRFYAKNVYNIDNVDYISEIGLCSSIDYNLPKGREALLTQINYFLSTNLNLNTIYNDLVNEDFDTHYLYVDIGGSELLRYKD